MYEWTAGDAGAPHLASSSAACAWKALRLRGLPDAAAFLRGDASHAAGACLRSGDAAHKAAGARTEHGVADSLLGELARTDDGVPRRASAAPAASCERHGRRAAVTTRHASRVARVRALGSRRGVVWVCACRARRSASWTTRGVGPPGHVLRQNAATVQQPLALLLSGAHLPPYLLRALAFPQQLPAERRRLRRAHV